MISYYKFADVVMSIEHSNDELFKQIDDEMKLYSCNEQMYTDCKVFLNANNHDISLPKKAIRTSISEDRLLYTLDNKTYIQKKDSYLAVVDYVNKIFTLNYKQFNTDFYSFLRGLVKWLFIKAAEDKGVIYIHGAALSYKGKVILLTGDTNSGKSSSVFRFIQDGAKVISDDSVMIKNKVLIPFTFKSKVDEHAAKRFNIKPELFDIGDYISKEHHDKIDYVFFLKIWNNDSSEIKPMSYEQALLTLIRIYQKEIRFTIWQHWDKNSDELTRTIFKNYASILENTKCFEFYAGNNEKEVREKMLGFLK